ncbi:hypothetical protein BGX31_007412 [Mortierella sp. GBA43]|nr:hypothetical protein BGX31_007412 [Mortierella sp. GBA43]
MDSKAGHHIVLWRDIQRVFEGARFVLDDNSLVSLMTDDDFEEIPYRPSVVLEVVVGTQNGPSPNNQAADTSLADGLFADTFLADTFLADTFLADTLFADTLFADTLPADTLPPNASLPDTLFPDTLLADTFLADTFLADTSLADDESSSHDLGDITHTPENTGITIPQAGDTEGDTLPAYSARTTETFDPSVPAYSTLRDPGFSTSTAEEAGTYQYLDGHVGQEREYQELFKNKDQRAYHLQQKSREKGVRGLEFAPDEQAVMQSRLREVFTRPYDFHEHLIPRLFMVLPKTARALEKLTRPSNQFRVYFLCECGTHTMSECSKMQHNIHLAKHEGYDLEKPEEFFKKYGSYVLTLMNMIKYGIAAYGHTIPPVRDLQLTEGMDTTQKHMHYLKENLVDLVDDIIEYLNSIKHNSQTGDGLAVDHAEPDRPEVLKSTDLSQLESYLNVKDKGRVLANLYRIATPSGHVKWVCFDHYRAIYQESEVRELREAVKVNDGTFIEKTGRIEIEIATSTLAKQFYDAMIKARGIQELDITLEWDATMNDFRSLANAVTQAKVVQLTMNGSYFKASPFDVINRGQRFDPILQLASSSWIQSLQLREFQNFFSRVSKSAITPAPTLRIFKANRSCIPNLSSLQIAYNFLEQCSVLTTLELDIDFQYSIIAATSDILSKVPSLESMTIGAEGRSFHARVSNGEIQDLDLTVQSLADLDIHGFTAMHKQRLTRISVSSIHENEVGRLADVVLYGFIALKHLQVGSNYKHAKAIVSSVISSRKEIIQCIGSSFLRTFNLLGEGLSRFPEVSMFHGNNIESLVSFQDNSSSFKMLTRIRGCDSLGKQFAMKYGSSVLTYERGYDDRNYMEITTFQDIMKMISEGSALENLRIISHSSGVTYLDKIIQKSPNFKGFGLFVDLGVKDQFKTAKELISRHGEILDTLCLESSQKSGKWSLFALQFPTRSSFPTLRVFDVRYRIVQPRDISWIVAMISAPPQVHASSSGSQSIKQDVADRKKEKNSPSTGSPMQGSWTSLHKFALERATLSPEEWKSVIEAIDFSELRQLSFVGSNISPVEVKLLVDRIPHHKMSKIPLEALNVGSTPASKLRDSDPIFNELRKKLPWIKLFKQNINMFPLRW